MYQLLQGKISRATKLTANARDFKRKYMDSVLGCLCLHFGGNKELFLERWGAGEGKDFHGTKFVEKCKGIGNVCEGREVLGDEEKKNEAKKKRKEKAALQREAKKQKTN